MQTTQQKRTLAQLFLRNYPVEANMEKTFFSNILLSARQKSKVENDHNLKL